MKIGILGAGHIAEVVAPTLIAMAEMECYAVSSRSIDKAQAFAEKFGFEKAYGSYDEMLADPNVELVYVATPHSHHFEHMMLAIAFGKNILCEKAFTINAREAEMIRFSAESRAFMWRKPSGPGICLHGRSSMMCWHPVSSESLIP